MADALARVEEILRQGEADVGFVGARLPAVASPSGGTTIDTEARAAIAALIATLKSHGLTE